MNYKQYGIISLVTFLVSILLFAYQNEYIILNWGTSVPPIIQNTVQKKNISLYYWYQNEWHTEQEQFLISPDILTTVHHILTRLLTLMHEEKILKKKIILQCVLISANEQELFLSFNRPPWNKESNTYQKWMALEGILKTVAQFPTSIKKVHFLVDHQPINDSHLDFTNAWPINGFQ